MSFRIRRRHCRCSPPVEDHSHYRLKQREVNPGIRHDQLEQGELTLDVTFLVLIHQESLGRVLKYAL